MKETYLDATDVAADDDMADNSISITGDNHNHYQFGDQTPRRPQVEGKTPGSVAPELPSAWKQLTKAGLAAVAAAGLVGGGMAANHLLTDKPSGTTPPAGTSSLHLLPPDAEVPTE
tara:strand:- start:25388 stop:25735 length:348 start_codon:yes stop_codon:yes gene_type:complete